MQELLSKKQRQFIVESIKGWNLAHGPVSSGKTVGTLFRFLQSVAECPDNQIYMFGHSSTTVFENCIKLILQTPEFIVFRPFCTWFPGKNELRFKDKIITVIGAKDEGSIGRIQGKTISIAYCDEMTLYPENVIDMIDTRLRLPHSIGFASMNPKQPTHKLKQWIDSATDDNPNYYALGFSIDDNPYLPPDYKERLKNSLTGLFYKRNYLGIWCLAEGAIFDFFDINIHVTKSPPKAAEYWICGIDYGISNAFACVLIGVNTGKLDQTGKRWWVEKEYYWDCKKKGRQKINSEFADDIQEFIEPYAVKQLYIDPSALSMKLELQRRGMHVIEADNDVFNGISTMTTEMGKGNLTVCKDCHNLIREIQTYVWDDKKSKEGEDKPIKKGDHAVDALRYAIQTHKIEEYKPYKDPPNNDYMVNRFQQQPRKRI